MVFGSIPLEGDCMEEQTGENGTEKEYRNFTYHYPYGDSGIF